MNEYEIKEKVGNGSFGKVYRVTRSFYDEQGQILKADYAMKVFNKLVLQNQRQIVYLTATESKMITSMDYVNKIKIMKKYSIRFFLLLPQFLIYFLDI